jgi:hypothetical protein
MRDISPALIVACGGTLICGILLLLVGMSAMRFTVRFGFILPILSAVIGFFTNRRNDSEQDVRLQQHINRPVNQRATEARAQPQALDFDAAVNHYRQQQSGVNNLSPYSNLQNAQPTQPAQPQQPYSPAQTLQPGQPTQPNQPLYPAQTLQPGQPTQPARPLIPNSPDLNSPAIQPGQPGHLNQTFQPGQAGQQPLRPPLRSQTPGPNLGGNTQQNPNTQPLSDDDLERYNLRSRFPNNRPVYGNRQTRQKADENEDFIGGLLGSEEEFFDDGDGGLF